MKTTTILISPQSEDDLKNEKKIENEKLKMKPKLKMTFDGRRTLMEDERLDIGYGYIDLFFASNFDF